MIGLPPVSAGAVQLTVAEALPRGGGADGGRGRRGGRGHAVGGGRGRAGTGGVDGGHREGVAGAVGQPGHGTGWPSRDATAAVMLSGGGVHRVAGDRATAGVGRRGPAHRRRGVARGGGADGGRGRRSAAGVTLLDGAEAGPVPTALVAATVKV